MLWDQGWWAPQDDFAKGLKDGKLNFVLHGERMKGGWALVRMRGKAGEKRENWLLIKEHDAFEEDDEDALTERYETSVASGRDDGRDRGGQKADEPQEDEPRRGRKTESRSASPRATAFRKPQLAKLTDTVPEGDDWLHETKFDGYRCLAALGKGGVTLYTRSGLDWTDRYAGLPEAFSRARLRQRADRRRGRVGRSRRRGRLSPRCSAISNTAGRSCSWPSTSSISTAKR